MIFLLGLASVSLADVIIELDTPNTTWASFLAVWALENVFIFGILLARIFISVNTTVKEAINLPQPILNQPAAQPLGPAVDRPVYDSNFPQYS
jgi:hypothetical protein